VREALSLRGWGCLRMGCWGEYLDLRRRKWQEGGRSTVVWSFMTCTVHQMLRGGELLSLLVFGRMTTGLDIFFHCHKTQQYTTVRKSPVLAFRWSNTRLKTTWDQCYCTWRRKQAISKTLCTVVRCDSGKSHNKYSWQNGTKDWKTRAKLQSGTLKATQ
jgi:hypothetical protein